MGVRAHWREYSIILGDADRGR